MARPEDDPVAWERVKEVLADTLERAQAERAAFLDQACAGDPVLRAEVESLLPGDDTSQAFLARPATELFDAPAPEPGTRIGVYTLRSLIGEGGMGRVYEAAQEHPHRTVALKVLRPGFLAADAERRFHWEVEALGRLNHPAIARVHDAGVEATPGGHKLSWFAMEKVEGRPLLEAVEALDLDRRQRLEFFVRVCDGVAHAHQRGVIHRDLKPDNILVDAEGLPHILDFGIARAADPLASSVTTAGEVVGTLAYMSPEQVLGEPERVDARSDVYALGVILHRLLTGQAPLDLEGLPLPLVALRLSQEDPRPASQFDRSLRGDLETILATALAREADRRYPTVDALAADVRRVLADEPIAARPPTAWYQLTKFARRNRGLVTGAGLALLALIGAVIGTSIGFVRANHARERAVVERDRALRINRFIDRIFASADPDLDGHDVRVVDLLDRASADLEGETELEPAVLGGLHLTLGNTYRHLTLYEPARKHLVAAAALLTAEDGELADTSIEALSALGEVHAAQGELELAEEAARGVRAAVARRKDPPAWVKMRPLELDSSLADAAGDLLRYEQLCRQVFEGWMELESEGGDEVETARNNYAVALLANGRGAQACTLLRRGIEASSAVVGPDHDNVLTQRLNLAQGLSEMGSLNEALAQFQELEPLALEKWGPNHQKTLAIRNNLAVALQDLGRVDEALPIYEDLLAVSIELLGPDHVEVGQARNNLSVAFMLLERFEDAQRVLEEALASLDRDENDHPVVRVRIEMNLASALEGQDLLAQARPVSARVLRGLEELVGADHQQTLISRNNHALLLMRLGASGEAVELALLNQRLAEQSQPDHPHNTFPFRMNLGRILASAGRFEEAETLLLEVEAHLRGSADPLPDQRARIREVLAEFYEDWGKPQEAARWREE